tara:strand:+ start:195 stop:953 length:759 start_codon:yes stop_codon:yes gene_type:complete
MKKFKLTFIFGFLLFLIFSSKAYSFCPKNFKSTENATFGVKICSSKKVAGQYHRHAEKVMRSLLDYDKDGKPDNKKVHENLIKNRAIFMIFGSEFELELYEDQFEDFSSFTVVFTDEMVLNNLDIFDATIEEALHLVTAEGYSKAYPKLFGEFKGSKIALFLDEARGGYFFDVPREYPEEAYFTYTDYTCDYSCQITEFLYWAITTLRGQQGSFQRDKEIEEEWKPETKRKLELTAPELVRFLSKKEFRIFY